LQNGTYRKKMFKIPANYNLMIIDEFQNYLPEQLAILKSCVNDRLESVIYVGDIAQQTYFGTVKSWAEIHHEIKPERFVTLQRFTAILKKFCNTSPVWDMWSLSPKKLKTASRWPR